MSKGFTFADVLEHNSRGDLYLVIDKNVYDVTKFADEHPGGETVLCDSAGEDATEAFDDVGHSDEARQILSQLHVGALMDTHQDTTPGAPATKVQVAAISRQDRARWAFVSVVLLGCIVSFFAYRCT